MAGYFDWEINTPLTPSIENILNECRHIIGTGSYNGPILLHMPK